MTIPRALLPQWRACLILALAGGNLSAQYLDRIGVTDLRNRYGVTLPQGVGITGWQTEATETANVNVTVGGVPAVQQWSTYWPNLNNASITSGRSITLYGLPTHVGPLPLVAPDVNPPSSLTFSSGHATTVGAYWYGAPSSGVSPAMSTLVSMSAESFLDSAALQFLSGTAPVVNPLLPTPSVVNASWVGASPVAAANVDLLRRADYLVDRDGITVVAGLDNFGGGTPSALLTQGYNTIAVGRSDGGSAGGLSTVDGTGRVVVDVVAPLNASSYTAPLVAGTVVLIADRAQETPAMANADDPRVTRSLILTGAEKLTGWANSPTQPLDLFQGAGELRVNNTYDVLMAGEKEVGSVSTLRGWDLGTGAVGVQYYLVDNTQETGQLTVTLAWNRVTGDPADPTGTARTGSANFTTMGGYDILASSLLADLNLEVWSTDGVNTPVSLLASSLSTADNVEHIFLQDLPAGRYAIGVIGGNGTQYGLSFNFVPEVPTGLPVTMVGLAAVGLLVWRRRGV